MAFNIAAARQDGISDTDIAQHLAELHGFNIDAARKDGLSDKDIAEHLAEKSVTLAKAKNAVESLLPQAPQSVMAGNDGTYTGASTAMPTSPVQDAANLDIARQYADAQQPQTAMPALADPVAEAERLRQQREQERGQQVQQFAQSLDNGTAAPADAAASAIADHLSSERAATADQNAADQAAKDARRRSLLTILAGGGEDSSKAQSLLDAGGTAAAEQTGRKNFAKTNPLASNFVSGALLQGSGALDSINLLADTVNHYANKVTSPLGVTFNENTPRFDIAKEMAANALDYQPSVVQKKWDDLHGIGEKSDWLATQLAGQAPQMAGWMVAALNPELRAVSLGTMGLTSGGQQYTQDKQAGVEKSAAIADSFINAAAEIIPETVELNVFDKIQHTLKALPPAQRVPFISNVLRKATIIGAAAGEQIAVEGGGEAATQLAQNASQKYVAGDNNIGLMDNVKEAGIIGAAMGVAFSAPHILTAASQKEASDANDQITAAHVSAITSPDVKTVDDAIAKANEAIHAPTVTAQNDNDALLAELARIHAERQSQAPSERNDAIAESLTNAQVQPMAQAAGTSQEATRTEQPAPPIPQEQINAIPPTAETMQQPHIDRAVPAGDSVRPDSVAGQGIAAPAAGTGAMGSELAARAPERTGDAAGADARLSATQQANPLTQEQTNGTQATQAVAPEAQREETPAAVPVTPVFGTNSAGRITLRGVPTERIQAVRDSLGLKGVVIGKDSAIFPKGTDLSALKTAFGVENVAAPAKPKRAIQASTDLLQRIKQLGGINSRYAADVTGEQKPKGAWKFAFGKNGLGLDDLATQLAAEGFNIDLNDAADNGGVNQLAEMIRQHIGGERAFKATTQEAQAEAEAQDRDYHAMRQRAEELGIKVKGLGNKELADAIYSAEDAIRMDAIAEREAISDEGMAAASKLADMIESGEHIPFGDEVKTDDAALAAFLGEQHGENDQRGGSGSEQSAAERAGEGAGRSAQAGGEPQGNERPLLESYTNAEVLAREAAKAKAEEEASKEPPAKHVNADQADLFNTQDSLFNSNREQPVVKESLTSQPSAESKDVAQSKKLEVLKAQAQGKITGDQGAALKELADAGEHAAVDEVLKPAMRDATTQERIASEKASPVNDLNDKPTGWKRIEGANNDSVTLVSYDGKKAVQFVSADKRSGTASVRMNAEAHAYAIDNPYQGELTQGELVSKPLFGEAGKIDDFGEKLAGAKKDLWQTYRKAMSDELPADIKEITLSKHFPEPDYEGLIASGTDIRAIAAIKAMRDEIPSKPQKSYKLQRWAEQLKTLRAFSNDILSGDISVDKVMSEMRKVPALQDIADRIDLYAQLGYPALKSAKGYEISGGWTRPGVQGEQFGLRTPEHRVSFFNTRQEAVDALRAKLETAPETKDGGRSTKLDIYRVTSTGDIVIGKKVGSNKYIDLKTGFESARAAREYLAQNEKELLELLDKKKEVRPERRSVNNPRIGKDYRVGEDATPEKFAAEFGFRGVQFGNYVEQARRAKDLNNAYDALLDMANIIGVPPRAVSLNGSLGLAFGARGSGGKNAAAAHFEPDMVVINLTKANGFGSLGHEWFHAMDNYFSRMLGKADGHITDIRTDRYAPVIGKNAVTSTSVRPEALAAFKELMTAIRNSDFYKRSVELDKRRSKDYWSTNTELGARAFESYLISKAEANGESNDYLANIVSEETHKISNEMFGEEPYPYPTKADQEKINPAFDKLFDTLQTKETDKGVALYSRANQQIKLYSQLSRQIEAAPDRVFSTGKQTALWLQANTAKLGIKKDELYWSGINDWLHTQGKVSKEDVLNYLEGNGVQVQEVMLGNGNAEVRPEDGGFAIYDNGNFVEWYETEREANANIATLGKVGGSPETKFASYQLPGGENYRELLLTLPVKGGLSQSERAEFELLEAERKAGGINPGDVSRYNELSSRAYRDRQDGFRSSHFDQPNILAHIRFNERTDAQGKRVLFIEELQSDWGQKGKKEGFGKTVWRIKGDVMAFATREEADAYAQQVADISGREKREVYEAPMEGSVPSAPFVTDTKAWTSLALKRMIAYAVDNGFDRVAWTTGEQQAARYDLSKQVQAIHYAKRGEEYTLKVIKRSGDAPETLGTYSASKLEEVIGKDAAKKVIDGEGSDVPHTPYKSLSGLDLKVGGEGMKGYYDQIVPQVASDILKKFGGKVDVVKFSKQKFAEDGTFLGVSEKPLNEQPGFTITPEMRQQIQKDGLPLFSKGETSGQTVESVTKATQALRNRWLGLRKINIIQSAEELPRDLTDRILRSGGGLGGMEGVFDPKTKAVYLIADNLSSPERAVWVAAHEVVGHGGIRMLGKPVADVVDYAAKNSFVTKLAHAIADDRGENFNARIHTDEAIAELAAATVTDNVDEIMGRYGVAVPKSMRANLIGTINRVVEAVRNFLAKVLGKQSGEVSDSEIYSLLTSIRGAAEGFDTSQSYDEAMAQANGQQVEKARREPRNDYERALHEAGISASRSPDDLDFTNPQAQYNREGTHHGQENATAAGRESGQRFQTVAGLRARPGFVEETKIRGRSQQPLAVFRGADASLEAGHFDQASLGYSTGYAPSGRGVHFTTSRQYAAKYGQVQKYYLDIRNPFVFKSDNPGIPDFDRVEDYYAWREGLRKQGYDGIVEISSHLGGANTVIAFDPHQVIYPDEVPLASRAPRATRAMAPEETTGQKIQRIAQDKMNRFSVIRDWLKSQGHQLSEAADVWMHEGNMYGKVAARSEDFRTKTVEPLIERTQKAGFTMGQVAEYLEMQHVPEANARMREIHGDPEATANGVTDEEAQAVLDKYRAMPNFDKLQEVAAGWRAITDSTRQILLNSGIITPEMAAAWKATYQNYVPLKGDETQTGTGKGLNVNGKTKRRLGHGDREEAVIQNILRDHERAINLAEKNAVGIALVRMAVEAQNDDLVTVGKPERRQVYKDQSAFAVAYQGNVIGSFDTKQAAQDFIKTDAAMAKRQLSSYGIEKTSDPTVVYTASPMLADNEVNVYINGHAVRVQLNDELLARAYTNMGVEHVGMLLAGARAFNSWLSKAYTGYNPEFALVNMARDMFAGSINLAGDYGVGMTAKIYANYPKAFKELARSFNDPAKSEIVQAYRKAGGNTGAAYLPDLERIGSDVMDSYNEYAGALDTLQRVYQEERGNGKGKAYAGLKAAAKAGKAKFMHIPLIGHFLTMMEHVNAVTENALRLATYMTLKENGHSDAKAAQAAKLSTVNFNRKGEMANTANALYLFFNPNVQGTHRLIYALGSAEHKNQARALVGIMSLGAFLLAEAMRGEDDDKWKRIPGYIKDRNIVIMAGDTQFTIPVPYGYGIFHTLGNVMSDVLHGDNGWKAGARLTDAMFNNFSPAGDPFQFSEGLNPIKDGNLNLLQIAPTAMKMVMSPTVGEDGQDGFGRPLMPHSFNQATPDSQKMYRTTKGTMYERVAQGMNELTGGNNHRAGAVDVSPETVKYWVDSLTGGAGKFVADSINLAAVEARGADAELREVPVVRKFVRTSSIVDARQQYYSLLKDAQQAAAEFQAAVKARDKQGAMQILQDERPLLAMAKYGEAYSKAIKAKRDLVDKIREDDSLSLAEKRNRIKAVEQKEEALYDKFISTYEARVK